MTIYWLPSNGAITQCGRKVHAIKAGRTSRVQHIDGGGKHHAEGIQVHGSSPPRRRHNDSKEAMSSSDVQPGPVLVAGVIVGVWPFLDRPPLWLAIGPPNDPFLVKPLNVGDRGGGVTLVSPVNNFLGTGPQSQPACALECRLANNSGQRTNNRLPSSDIYSRASSSLSPSPPTAVHHQQNSGL